MHPHRSLQPRRRADMGTRARPLNHLARAARTHEIGHKFDRTPHFNAWSESTGTSSKKNVHLYYE